MMYLRYLRYVRSLMFLMFFVRVQVVIPFVTSLVVSARAALRQKTRMTIELQDLNQYLLPPDGETMQLETSGNSSPKTVDSTNAG